MRDGYAFRVNILSYEGTGRSAAGHGLRLSVVSVARAGGYSRLIDFDFERMVLIRAVAGESFEGEDVVNTGVGNALSDFTRYIVI